MVAAPGGLCIEVLRLPTWSQLVSCVLENAEAEASPPVSSHSWKASKLRTKAGVVTRAKHLNGRHVVPSALPYYLKKPQHTRSLKRSNGGEVGGSDL